MYTLLSSNCDTFGDIIKNTEMQASIKLKYVNIRTSK